MEETKRRRDEFGITRSGKIADMTFYQYRL
jgi:hypothetical protein